MKAAQMTVAEIETWLAEKTIAEVADLLPLLATDHRRSVQVLVRQWQGRVDSWHRTVARWCELQAYEGELGRQGRGPVAGIDEAGRGPLAGPVVAAAVILPPDAYLPGLDDSKKLTSWERQDLYGEITGSAVAWAVGSSSPQYIDARGIVAATRQAMYQALDKLSFRPRYLLLDAMNLPECSLPQEGIVGGDGKCACIAAASVIAKVTRDRWMEAWDRQFPGYGFARHKGYPTPEHLAALLKLGPSPLHRLTFAPVAELAAGNDRQVRGG